MGGRANPLPVAWKLPWSSNSRWRLPKEGENSSITAQNPSSTARKGAGGTREMSMGTQAKKPVTQKAPKEFLHPTSTHAKKNR